MIFFRWKGLNSQIKSEGFKQKDKGDAIEQMNGVTEKRDNETSEKRDIGTREKERQVAYVSPAAEFQWIWVWR